MSLEGLGVVQRVCDGEADPELAAEAAAAGGRVIVHGMDSDYYLFRECPYVPFGGIKFHSTADSHLASAVVLSRHLLSESLGVPESLLIDWALYLGNDYTSGDDNSRNFSVAPEGGGELVPLRDVPARSDPLGVLEFLQIALGGGRLCSSDAGLQLAIDFSRAQYPPSLHAPATHH